MNKMDIHQIIDTCLDEGKIIKLYGQIKFVMHFQEGTVRQITDTNENGERTRKRTWTQPLP